MKVFQKYSELLILALSVIGLSAMGYVLFFQNKSVERKSEKSDQIATIRPQGQDIRMKPPGSLSWQAIQGAENAFDRDTVFTGQASRATVDFDSGTQVQIDPQSLIVISRENKSDKILALDYGGFSGKILKGDRITIQTKEKKIEISGISDSAIRIEKTSDQKLVISNAEGNLQVKSELKIEELSPNEELSIPAASNDMVKVKLPLVLLSPRLAKTLWLSPGSPVHFEWKNDETSQVKLTVSSDPQMKNIVKEIASQDQKADLVLPSNQSYYWRIESESEKSPVSEFTLASLTVPKITLPSANQVIKAGQSPDAEVSFQWQDEAMSDQFEVVVSKDSAFSSIVFKRQTKLNKFTLRLNTGTYFWKVQSSHPDRSLALESQALQFEVKTDAVLDEPKVVIPVAAEVPQPPPQKPAPLVAEAVPPTVKVEPQISVPMSAPKAKAVMTQAQGEKMNRKPAAEQLHHVAEPVQPPTRADNSTEDLTPSSPPALESKPAQGSAFEFFPKFWMSFGVGANYTRIDEKSSEVKSSYPGLSAPSFSVESGIAVTDGTAVAISYKTTPANGDNKAENSSQLTYVWKTAGVEASTLLTKADLQKQNSQWTLLYGIQYHALPVVIFESSTLLPSVREAQYLNASVGGKYQYFVSPRQFFAISGRYQYPLSLTAQSLEGFELKSPLIFDGSVGAEYRLTEALWSGVYWYGQYHSFKFNYTESGLTHENTQSMIYSNIELRLSFRF